MELHHINSLRGSNRWAGVPVLEVTVDVSGCENGQSMGAEFAERVQRALPAMPAVTESALPPAHWLALATRQLQRDAGVNVTYAQAHPLDGGHPWLVTVEFEEERLARACLETAHRLCLAAANGGVWDARSETRKLVDFADDVRLGPSTLAIVNAAVARGIPFHRPTSTMLIRLGEGCRQQRIWTAVTHRTSAIGADVAGDKEMTRRLLGSVGVPVPAGRAVHDAADAWAAACEIGLPVTVKPRDGNHTRAVTVEARTREQVVGAFAAATLQTNTGVVVERFISGLNWRLLVVGERLVAATRGNRRAVTGDGVRTVRQLIDEVNREPERGENYSDRLDTVILSHATVVWLARQGYTPESVPEPGAQVVVQMVGDMTTDVTDVVHPHNVRHAIRAAKVVGLDVAGLDIVTEDISRPLEEQNGAIVDVNAGPSLTMHLHPLEGQPRPVGEAIVDLMFAPGENGRIPLVVVAGGGDRTAVACEISRRMLHAGRRVGLATSNGVFFNGAPLPSQADTGHDRAEAVLLNPEVDLAVIECNSEETNAAGLAAPRCDVLVVPELPDAPAELPVRIAPDGSLAALAAALAAVRAVPEDGIAVLPAGPAAAKILAPHCRGQIIYFAPNDSAPELVAHRRAGGRTAFVRGDRAVFATGDQETTVPVPGDRPPLVAVASCLPAWVAAWAAGCSLQ